MIAYTVAMRWHLLEQLMLWLEGEVRFFSLASLNRLWCCCVEWNFSHRDVDTSRVEAIRDTAYLGLLLYWLIYELQRACRFHHGFFVSPSVAFVIVDQDGRVVERSLLVGYQRRLTSRRVLFDADFRQTFLYRTFLSLLQASWQFRTFLDKMWIVFLPLPIRIGLINEAAEVMELDCVVESSTRCVGTRLNARQALWLLLELGRSELDCPHNSWQLCSLGADRGWGVPLHSTDHFRRRVD